MAETVTIARPYADAAFKLASEQNALGQWSEMLELLEAVTRDERVAGAITNPNIGSDQRAALILGVCGERLNGAARNFVQVLAENGRLTLVPEMRMLFEQLKLDHEGVLEAQIESAYDMDDAQVRDVVDRLKAKYRRKIRAQVRVNRDLIGGVKITVGDKVFDASVRGKLEAMSAALIR